MHAPPIGPSLPLALRVLLSQRTTSLDLTSQTWFLTSLVEVEADDPGQLQGLVHGEPGGLEGVPGQDVPLGQRVEVVLPLDGGELLHPPAFDLAAGGVEGVLGPDGVGVESSSGKRASSRGFWIGRPRLQGPVLAEDLIPSPENSRAPVPRIVSIGQDGLGVGIPPGA